MGTLDFAHPAVRAWFEGSFDGPTVAQTKGWPEIAKGDSTLLLAPTGSGKTLAAFLVAIDRLMFSPEPDKRARLRVLYISPLKALGVDVERNLRGPLVGIRAVAERDGHAHRPVMVGVRSGDTSSAERARLVRQPPDILITTPESLYLMLTSNAREILKSVDTVIIDEIHAMVASKRGAHLFLSLERLEDQRDESRPPLQRIGLSATQRPLEEVARLLVGGETVTTDGEWRQRSVAIVDAGRKRSLDLKVEVPVDDMANLPTNGATAGYTDDSDDYDDDDESLPSGPAFMGGGGGASIWTAIHPRLVELIKAHRSTMIFVNSRRTAERLAAAINETAEEELALAHHGSLAKDRRKATEDRLKRGELPAIVATSSLELGIDMGAVDLVIQIEAPPSVASGLQRVGRAGHHVGGVSKGVMFPKYRGDLLASAAALVRMHEGLVEATYYPRNPLDVLAQHLVAMVSVQPMHADEAYALVRRSAPFAELPRASFEGVLDMLSGLYPSEQFAELRARITYDRVGGTLSARAGAKRIAVVNGGTIPDRGLYGVFLADGNESGSSKRVGELDEEMVFESRPGDVFLLGASSWRIEDITHDRVLVVPAPGEPGKMPFWHGDRPGRPLEFGRAIGELTRKLGKQPEAKAIDGLTEAGLDPRAASNLLAYINDQREVTEELPTDRTIVCETFVDEIGDHRVCILSPFGARVHAPWATAIVGQLRHEQGIEADMMYSDDGIVFRLPEADRPPDLDPFIPRSEDIETLVIQTIADTSLFAARFRENAARALLLPKRRPGQRMPLWAQRRRSADLLAVASQFESFPMMLETYRECLKDAFDLPGLIDVLRQVESRKIRVVPVASKRPSPFATSLLFTYVSNFMYEGDAPLAERRAQALSIDHAQLRELLGEAELRELLDADAIEAHERKLQRLDPDRAIKHQDALHDLLLSLGDLRRDEIVARAMPDADVEGWLESLVRTRRVIEISLAGDRRFAAAEDAGKLRDALGVLPPPGLPDAFLSPHPDPLIELVTRYARTHGPFTAGAFAERYRLGTAVVNGALTRLAALDRLLQGEFIPGGRGEEWCDPDVLRVLKRQSLAKLRKQVEPVDASALARFVPAWHGMIRPRAGLDALLTVIEQLQGTALVGSVLETEILPTRVKNYAPADLDELFVAGEVVWRGLEPLGPNDGRIALYLTDHYPILGPVVDLETPNDDEEHLPTQILEILRAKGALLFSDLQTLLPRFPQDLADALWTLVWSGAVSNDTLAPLRARVRAAPPQKKGRSSLRGRNFRSRRQTLPGTQGRWSLLPDPMQVGPSETERRTALAHQLLERHGVLTREAVAAEGISGAFSAVYPVLKALEEAGRIRRGYFVSGLGATQFALPGAEDRLRGLREPSAEPGDPIVIAATDPANPFGAALPWPTKDGARPQRAAGAQVILFEGELLAYLGRTEQTVWTYLPEHEPELSDRARRLAETLAKLIERGRRASVLFTEIDGGDPRASVLAPFLADVGFSASSRGLMKRRAHA